jgi:hypothetical protein
MPVSRTRLTPNERSEHLLVFGCAYRATAEFAVNQSGISSALRRFARWWASTP